MPKYSVTIDFAGEEAASPLEAALNIAHYLDENSTFSLFYSVSDEEGKITGVDMAACGEYDDSGNFFIAGLEEEEETTA